jgi:hypothetical protein
MSSLNNSLKLSELIYIYIYIYIFVCVCVRACILVYSKVSDDGV